MKTLLIKAAYVVVVALCLIACGLLLLLPHVSVVTDMVYRGF